MKKVFLLGLALVAMAATSQASVIISLTNVTVDGANFDWNYDVVLSGDQNFRNFASTSDQTEVFDFGGFVSASFIGNVLATANSSVVTAATGPLSSLTGDTAILNVILRNTGATIFGTGSSQDLGTLVVVSTQGAAQVYTSSFATQAQKIADSTTTFNQGFVNAPLEPGTPTPEPATLALFGSALLGLGLLRRRKA